MREISKRGKVLLRYYRYAPSKRTRGTDTVLISKFSRREMGGPEGQVPQSLLKCGQGMLNILR